MKRLCVIAILMLFVSTTVDGQTIRGQIAGTVTDETGAALPGVSITLTSPALQVPQIQRITDERGTYLFSDLPAAAYRLTYELPGFSTIVREDFRLTSGFAARADTTMKVATVAETITVSGESPLIDVTTTRGGTTVTQQLLQELPTNKNFQDIFVVVGGLQITGPPLSGGGGQRETGVNNNPKTYGQRMQTNNTFEGLVVQSNEIPNFSSFEEVDVRSFGNTAESANPSASVSMVVKSGGNQFHGRVEETGQHKRLQSDNIDDELRSQGITSGDAMIWQHHFTGDLGGRIVRDKLWFYVAVKDVRGTRTVPGFVSGPGPDGVYLTGDEPLGEVEEGAPAQTFKVSYQPTQSHRFIGFGSRTPLFEWQQAASRFIPQEATVRHLEHDFAFKPLEWQWVVNSRLNVNMLAGTSGYSAIRKIQIGSENTPSRFNRETGLTTGANFNAAMGSRRPERPQIIGRVDYFPLNRFLGDHAIQAGYRVQFGEFATDFPANPYGDYRLVYDRVGGVPNQGVEIVTQNRPVKGASKQNLYAIYASDSWRPSSRLTMNIGLRWDRIANWVPPQVKVQGRFGSAGSFPKVDAGTTNTVSPRFGIAYDLSGDGKTVVKGSYGLFFQEWQQFTFNVGFAFDYNQNNVTQETYRWTDRDRNNDLSPGEVNFDRNGPDFLSVTGATNNLVNLDLKRPATHEVTASVEQSLGSTVSLRGLYVFKRVNGAVATVNVLRPFDVWNQAITRLDPGPDGVNNTADDGGLVTFYDYDPRYRGAAFVGNMRVNADKDRYDTFNNFEVMLTKRKSNRWFANASFLATKYHAWFEPVAQTPNDEFFPLNQIWELAGRVAAGYELPYGIELSTLTQAYNGVARQRTNIFRSVPNSGTITLRMEPFGAQRGPNRTITNLRGARIFRMGSRSVTIDVSAYNAFNSNVPWSSSGNATGEGSGITDASGPTYNFVTQSVSPRILRFGVAFEF
jgi:hypothetical protein